MAQALRKQWHTESLLNKCESKFIPENLKWKNRPVISFFDEKELLYWRLNPSFKEDIPFKEISLREISFNRSGVNNTFSEARDVLRQEDSDELLDWQVTILSVKHLSAYPAFRKTVREPSCVDTVDMCLIHDPLACNYSHSMIIFYLNGSIRVIPNNYDDTLNKSSNKRLRKSCKDELHKMLVRKQIALP